jgi:hypothetical protein
MISHMRLAPRCQTELAGERPGQVALEKRHVADLFEPFMPDGSVSAVTTSRKANMDALTR